MCNDDYIRELLKQGKVCVDPVHGVIYSTWLQRPYKPITNKGGYQYLDFKFFNQRRSVLVHRLVYIAVHGSIPAGFEIDHIDRDPSNNRISNLQALPAVKNLERRRFHDKSR